MTINGKQKNIYCNKITNIGHSRPREVSRFRTHLLQGFERSHPRL